MVVHPHVKSIGFTAVSCTYSYVCKKRMRVVAPMVTFEPLIFETILFYSILNMSYIYIYAYIRSTYRYTGSVQLLHHSLLRVTMFFLESVFLGGESAWIEEVQATRRLPHYYPPTRQYPKKWQWWVGVGCKKSKLLHEYFRHSMALQQNVYSCFEVLLW